MVVGDRVQLADSRADLWTFRAVTYAKYPAVGEGPFVLFCLQPGCTEWGAVRPGDLAADPELARLIPALRFMKQEFHRGPTLGEISRQVHLSPFHFHRRFAELLGLTPKHFLLECQINQAKVELLARKKELAQIATDCGFAHQSHFTSRFKQATGLTPTRWRRLATEPKRD
jgi:AraC-like DNA-binding protein